MRTLALGLFAFFAAYGLCSNAAGAKGTMTILQPSGDRQTYPNVTIKIVHDDLYLTSGDGKGTLVVNRAACFVKNSLMTCLPSGVILVQGGGAKPLALKAGNVYVNLTSTTATLSHSTMKVPPRSIVLAFTTQRGTSINLSGTIDSVVK